MLEVEDRVYTLRFWLLSLSAFLFITSFNILVPELPSIVDYYGGAEERGLPIMLFAFAALLSRPFSGKLVDLIGRKPIILIGGMVCVVIGCMYQFADGLTVFLLLRFLHGFSTGFTPVGNMSYLADICPPHRRGEAMGIIGMAASLGFPVGMFIGSNIAASYDWDTLFLTSSVFALVSVLLVSTFKETLPNTQRFGFHMLVIKKDDVFDKSILVPFAVMGLTIFSFGVCNIILFDQAESVGFSVEQKSIFFIIYAVTSLLLRYPSGILSDRFGRRNVMLAGVFFTIAATAVLANTNSKELLLLAGILYGIASGINSPTIFAWAVDLSDKSRVGRSMSTMFIGIEIGVMLGSGFAGYITAQNHLNFAPAHYTSMIFACVAFVILLMTKPVKPPIAQRLPNT